MVRIEQIDIPSVGEDDVKVKVFAAPVNPSDINSIQGKEFTIDNHMTD